MALYSFNEKGEQIVHSRFSRRGAVDLTYIFPEDKSTTAKLIDKITDCNLEKTYNVKSKSKLVRKIYASLLLKVLNRVCAGDTFMMPGKTGAHITVKPIPVHKAKRARKKGFFSEIDIIKSGLKIPFVAYDFGPGYLRKDRQVCLSKSMVKMLFKNAEEGKLPWTIIMKTKKYDNKNRRFY